MLIEGPCPNHGFPINHLYKDYDLMKRYLEGKLPPAFKGKRGKPGNKNKQEDACFPKAGGKP